jgi:DNA-binding NarL/FixJ family response regulator
MVSLPRIVTVDPSGEISRIARAAFDLTERSVIQIDIPDSQDALEEIRMFAPQVVICALEVDEAMRGIDLAMLIRQVQPDTQVIVIGGADDADELDQAITPEASFVYLRRPLEAPVFIRALFAALDGEDARQTMSMPAIRPPNPADLGPIPKMDLTAARQVLEKLAADLGAPMMVLADRRGEVLLEIGAVNLNVADLIGALLPATTTNVEVGSLIGGSKPATVQFFDGENYDVFVLSVGLHFFLCLIYDGAQGNRQFGAVTRFGRRGVEDLIAPLGASAFIFERPTAVLQERRRRRAAAAADKETIQPVAVKAEEWAEPDPQPTRATTTTAVEIPRMEPIPDLDIDLIARDPVDIPADLDALFDPDKLAEIANEARGGRGPLTYDEARELGILP